MGMRKRLLLCVLLCVLLVGILLVGSTPKRRIVRFVARHGDRLTAAIETDDGIPANIGIRTWNVWPGGHAMWEFILWTRGDTYYGCYYSPDDIACAFQNTDVPLVQQNGIWYWQGAGDNRGSTWKIEPQWYGFQAAF